MKTYAQILKGVVHQIFTDEDMPEWNPEHIEVVDISGQVVNVGDTWNGKKFTPPPTAPIAPNVDGFMSDMRGAMGGVVGFNNFLVAYPALNDAIIRRAWDEVAALIKHAKSNEVLSDTEYEHLRDSTINNNIPLELS